MSNKFKFYAGRFLLGYPMPYVIICNSEAEHLCIVVKTWEEKIRIWQRRMMDSIIRRNPALGLDQRAEYFVSLFERYLPEQSSILDVGGGWGFYAKPLRIRGHSVSILDIVKPGIQKAPVILYDGIKFPFEDKSLDVTLLITVLHHIRNPERVVLEVKRVTRKCLVVVEDLYQHRFGRWWTILRDKIFNFEYVGHPCQFKKQEEWLQFFEGHGFSLVEAKQVSTRLAGLSVLNGLYIFKL